MAGAEAAPVDTGATPVAGAEQTAAERARGRGRWVAAAVAALGLALFAVPFLKGPADRPQPASDAAPPTENASGGSGKCLNGPTGRANYDFTLKDPKGVDVHLSDYKGKVVLLNFWATWCGPCKVEIPEFVAAYDRYRDKGFVILGVLSTDDPSADDLRAFTKQFNMNYPIFKENEALDDAFGPLWALPTSFIISRSGDICLKHMGPLTKDVLDQEIKGLL
jgi:cytochrome c biogenesis protein CcmG/thiol:disulfide interchange protein DsbE